MIRFVDEAIEEYCGAKSTLPSGVCEQIAAFTRSRVPFSQMLIGELEGSFLGFLVSLTGAKRILEIGCFTGYSALAMAERLPSGGELITLDVNHETGELARMFWKKSPHGRKIKSVTGDALQSLPRLTGKFDLIFIDADKPNYLRYLRAGLSRLSPRGFLAVDNCLWGGEVLKPKAKDKNTRALQIFNDFVAKNKNLECCLLPVRDGIFLIRKRR